MRGKEGYFQKLSKDSDTSDMTSVGLEDDLNYKANGRRPNFFGKMKDNPYFKENGRLPQHFGKKTTLILRKMEDDLNFCAKWKTASIFK